MHATHHTKTALKYPYVFIEIYLDASLNGVAIEVNITPGSSLFGQIIAIFFAQADHMCSDPEEIDMLMVFYILLEFDCNTLSSLSKTMEVRAERESIILCTSLLTRLVLQYSKTFWIVVSSAI